MELGAGFAVIWLLWLAAWAAGLLLFIWLAVLVVRLAWNRPTGSGRTEAGRGSQRDEALEILRARYARGEISEAEFEQARRVLDH